VFSLAQNQCFRIVLGIRFVLADYLLGHIGLNPNKNPLRLFMRTIYCYFLDPLLNEKIVTSRRENKIYDSLKVIRISSYRISLFYL